MVKNQNDTQYFTVLIHLHPVIVLFIIGNPTENDSNIRQKVSSFSALASCSRSLGGILNCKINVFNIHTPILFKKYILL